MGIGPITIFDKSVIQSLTIDESVWFDTHYKANLTPLFFVETLADLKKEVSKGRTPEEVVGNLAEKTPIGGPPNVHHSTLCLAELYGNRIEMSRRAVVREGRHVTSGGRHGLVFDQAPEIDALQRWGKKEFLEIEYRFVSQWRASLSNIDLQALFKDGRDIISRNRRPKNLVEVKKLAVELLKNPGSRYFREMLKSLVPSDQIKQITKRWQAEGNPPISIYAPYTAHLMTVDLFFCIGLGADLIGRERTSNKIDLAYLYYLPFCMAFTSRDTFHVRTAPLFLAWDQVFIHGDDLKADLAKLDDHYDRLPEGVKNTGVISFAHFPPTKGAFLTSKIWDQLMAPRWRHNAPDVSLTLPAKKEKKIVEELQKVTDAPSRPNTHRLNSDEVDHLLVEFKMPIFKGKWRMLPPSVEKKIRE